MRTEQDPINLLVTVDRNYLRPLTVMLRSYIETNGHETTNLYVAHSSLAEQDLAQLRQLTASSGVHIHSVKITERWFSTVPVLERLPEESFYRLLAFHYLPAEVDKCLYLDPDILVRKPLRPLYDLDLGDNYLAAAGHLWGYRDRVNKRRLGLKRQQRYLNSGVMLMNLAAIRADFSLEDVLSRLEDNVQKLLLGDQDMANILFGRRALLLEEQIYNLDERTYRQFRDAEGWTLETVAAQTAIIHYNGKCKPWLNGYEGELDAFYPKVERKGPAPSGTAKKHVKSFFHITKLTKPQAIALGSALAFALVCVLSYSFFGRELLRLVSDPDAFRGWLGQFGVFDEVVFILLRAAQTVVKFIPAEPLEIASGYAWGAVPGMLYCVIGNMLGTLAIFALTRRYGRRLMDLLLPAKGPKLLSLFQGSDRLYPLLFFLYLIPGSPKDGFTYVVGLLPVKLAPFLLITFIARMPSVLSSTLCGSTLAEEQYLLSILIFAATLLLAALGGAVYHAVIKRKEAEKTPPAV